jgi:Leucine-rich repeat (LRR) protein
MSGVEFVVGGWFASAAIRKFVDKAGGYLGDNHDLHKATKEMLNNLKNILPETQSVLEEAEKRRVENKALKEWLKLVKDAAYEAEDVLDDFEAKNIREGFKTKGMVRKAASSIFKSAKNLILPDNDLRRLKKVIINLQQLCMKSSTFLSLLNFDSNNKGKGPVTTESREIPGLLLQDGLFLGRDNEIKFILTIILGHEIDPIFDSETNSQEDDRGAGASADYWDVVVGYHKFDHPRQISQDFEAFTNYVSSELTTGRHKEWEPMLLDMEQEQSPGTIPYGKPYVIPISGFCGVGKTALAEIIYNHRLLESHFHLKWWVYMSTDFSVDKMMRVILGEDFSHINQHNLKKIFFAKVVAKRFFLVLDDVCGDVCSMLVDFLPFFNKGAYGSVILITTQENSVANLLGTVSPIILNPLEWNYFLPLLEYYAFRNANITSEKKEALKAICEDIGRQLHGLPLAAKTVGILLRSSIDAEKWRLIRDNCWWETGNNNIFTFLAINYQHLDAKLKQCFAFCSIFPRNYIIERDRIIQMWIANNFIQPTSSHESRLEDIGKMWFDELVNKSFFLSIPWQHRYIMHSAIRGLAIAVSSNEIFVSDGDPNPCPQGCFLLNEHQNPCSHGYSIIDNGTRSIPSTTRHLTVRTSRLDGDLGECSHDKLRTLLLHGDQYISVDRSYDSILTLTTNLRVLELSYPGDGLEKYIKAISQLSHLRFLDLSFTSISELPQSFCSLSHLQVLDLRGCEFFKLPKNMNQMINLRHLYASEWIISSIYGIGKLTNLQELENFKITKEDGHKIVELAEMNEIGGNLSIENLNYIQDEIEAQQARLAEKKYLKVLCLEWNQLQLNCCDSQKILNSLNPHSDLEEWQIRNYRGKELPSWTIVTLSSIQCIYLKNCPNLKVLPPLGQLPLLETLLLERLGTEIIGDEFYGSGQVVFPSLKALKLLDMFNLEMWQPPQEKELFPRLEAFQIEGCEELLNSPLDSQKLPTLRKLEISNCREVLLESIFNKWQPLLTSLCISRIQSTVTLSYDNMPNLRTLSLEWSHVKFEGLQQAMSNLKSLILIESHICWDKELILTSLNEIKMVGTLNDIQKILSSSFASLKVLNVTGKAVDLGTPDIEGQWISQETLFERLPHLVELTFDIEGLPEFPSTLSTLISLKTPTLVGNLAIQSLPKRCMPPNLKELYIKGVSDVLEQRCYPRREDWHKIAHIPYIRVNENTIQMI